MSLAKEFFEKLTFCLFGKALLIQRGFYGFLLLGDDFFSFFKTAVKSGLF